MGHIKCIKECTKYLIIIQKKLQTPNPLLVRKHSHPVILKSKYSRIDQYMIVL